jgi:hypothetical protein
MLVITLGVFVAQWIGLVSDLGYATQYPQALYYVRRVRRPEISD